MIALTWPTEAQFFTIEELYEHWGVSALEISTVISSIPVTSSITKPKKRRKYKTPTNQITLI